MTKTLGLASQNDRPSFRVAIGVIGILVAVALIGTPAAGSQVGTPPAPEIDPGWPLSEAFVETFDGEIPGWMPQYEIDVELDAESRTLSGSLHVEYTNHTGQILSEIPFRLFPNAEYYGEGALVIKRVDVDGEVREAELSVMDTVLTVPFGRLLGVGRSIEIGIEFETVVPVDSQGSFGIFSHDAQRQTWILADWHPILAGWDADTSWGLEPPTLWGDPTFAETSLYDLRLTVPAGMSVVASGEESITSSGGELDQYHIVTGPSRDLALVLDDGFVTTEAMAGDVAVRIHLDSATNSDSAGALLDLAVSALNAYGERFGVYPYRELDIVQTELAGALGVSWTGLLFIDAAVLERDLPAIGDPASILTFTIVHEIGHQWWGNLVGVNSNDHAFLNESMANYTSVMVFEAIFGPVEAEMAMVSRLAVPYVTYLEQAGDGVVDRPVGEFESTTAFGRLVYGKGALGFLDIHLTIGDDAFIGAIANYRDDHAFGLAAPDDLLRAFEEAADLPLETIWIFWFDDALTTIADVEQVLAEAQAA